MPLLDKLLTTLDVAVEPFAVCDLRAGAQLDLDRLGFVSLHFVLSGAGRIVFDGRTAADFAPGTVIITPRGVSQRIEARCIEAQNARATGLLCVSPAVGLKWLSAGQGAPQVILACGLIRASCGAGDGLFDHLREALVVCFADDAAVGQTFQTLLGELARPRPGSRFLVDALMKQCLIYLLRRLIERQDAHLPWLAVLEDRRLGEALDAMLAHPEQPHGLEALAAEAGMSRSSFLAHFNQAFGQSPHEFLTHCRLKKAAQLLRATDLPVKAIAGRVGYRSRSSFSRAFKASFGTDPNAFREDPAGLPAADVG